MAAGRDLKPRAPWWLNCLICSGGLLATGAFIWRVLACTDQSSVITLCVNLDVPRVMGVAVLPVLLLLSGATAAAKRLSRHT